jgi:asparagine synthetase B (glutamine-hydrolysing)
MQLEISKKKQETVFVEVVLGELFVYYSLEEKEEVFESENLLILLSTSYSEEYINSFFFNQGQVTKESLELAFQKDGFCIVIDKKSKEITFNRDVSGLQTAYYYKEKNSFHINTEVHELAKLKEDKLNSESIYQLLYFDFLWDGQTIYENINQLKVGGKLTLTETLAVKCYTFSQPKITEKENNLSDEENIKQLRKEIVEAHKRYVNSENIVFLSGGIDSVAMLIALDDLVEKQKIENHSFKVKGTKQDETIYAQSIADHLKTPLKIIERDISGEINYDSFRDAVLKMNNPYTGIWTFSNQVSKKDDRTYFAGQDTRLHTPALNRLDSLAFNMFLLEKKIKPLFILLNGLLYPFRKIFDYFLKSKPITNKIFLGLRRAFHLFDIESYINLVYFKVDKAQVASYKLPLEFYDKCMRKYDFSTKNIENKRSLYNEIVSKKWIEQYVNDIRYMVDMVKNQGGKLAMPFYDMDLAKFSASIPFDLAIKTMEGESQFDNKKSIVKKYVLRESLKDKIDQKTFLRSKAVSQTEHITFNQGLGDVLKDIINKDLLVKNSFIKKYKFEEFIKRFLDNENSWGISDEKYLLKVYYLATLIIYSQNTNE